MCKWINQRLVAMFLISFIPDDEFIIRNRSEFSYVMIQCSKTKTKKMRYT